MEDVLDLYQGVYQGSYDDEHVLICMDEKPKQLIAEVRRVRCHASPASPCATTTSTSGRGS